MSDSLGFFQQLEYLTWREGEVMVEGGYGGQGQMERTWWTGWDGEDMVDSGLKECSRVTTYISSDWLSGSLENEVVQSKLLWGHTH